MTNILTSKVKSAVSVVKNLFKSEDVDCTWTCSQKSAASKSQDDVSGSTGADFIGSAVYQ